MYEIFSVKVADMLLGSFNWSRQAVVGNAENLVIHAGGLIIGMFT